MIYIFNFAPGINIRLFSEWFLKNQFSYNDNGYTLKFDDSGFNFKALKNDVDVTNEYILNNSKNFINGLPKPIYDELNTIPRRIFDLSDSDFTFIVADEIKRNELYKIINNLILEVDKVKQKNVIISGLFTDTTTKKLKTKFNAICYNIIINKNFSYQNSEVGVLNKLSLIDSNKTFLDFFNKSWELLENNNLETIYIENVHVINEFNQYVFKKELPENGFEFKKESFNIIKIF